LPFLILLLVLGFVSPAWTGEVASDVSAPANSPTEKAEAAPSPVSNLIREVRVRGNLRVDADAVLKGVRTRAGEVYEADKVREDIRTIYAMGYFDDVLVEQDAEGRVTFVVLERPALRHWELQENDVLKFEDVEKDVPLKNLEILRLGALENGAEILRGKFAEKGYYLARIEPELVPVDGGTNQADLIYHVEARERVKVRSIHIPGASYEASKEMKKDFLLQEETIWSWITQGAQFKTADLQRDAEWARAYYMERGYAQVRIGEPLAQLSTDLVNMEVTIPVTPGPVYHLGLITFSGDDKYPESTLREAAKIEKGNLFTMSSVRRAVRSVEDLYADEGYAFAEVVPRNRFNPEEGTIDLEFVIRKGERYRIGRIEMRGNEKTRDRVIRRDIDLAEGEYYSRSALARSERNLRKLGYFENVSISRNRRADGNFLDLDIEVKEQSTGTFSIGAGYSSTDRIFGVFNVSNRNLFGYGYQLSGDASVSSTRQTYSVSFNNPRIFDSDVFAGTDVYKTRREYVDYTKKSVGFDVKLGTQFWKDWNVRLTYGWDASEIVDVCTDAEAALGLCSDPAPHIVQEQAGKINTSKIGPSLSYDTRDSFIEPTEGSYGRFGVEWAGWILGGDAAYVKYELEARHYFPLFLETVFMLKASGGYLTGIDGKEVPVYERFALGGAYSLRGFDWRSVGPEEDGEVIGGNKYVLFNAEYVFPLIKEAKLNGVIFFDVGNAWDTNQSWFADSLRMGTGAGIRWFSPMGPLRLEYGYNLSPKDGESRAKWEFTIGGYF
jgi:outer membrane protein insertion porin family